MRRLLLIALVVIVPAACSSKSRTAIPVATAAQSDEVALGARVKTALLNDAIVGKRRIDVTTSGADIRLAGRVATAAERDRALELARAVPGVRTVTSDLEIRP